MLSPAAHTSLSLSYHPLPNKPVYILLHASKLPTRQLCKTCHPLKFQSHLRFFSGRARTRAEASLAPLLEPLCFLSASMKGGFELSPLDTRGQQTTVHGSDLGQVVNKVLLEQSCTHPFTYCLWLFLTTVAELNSRPRDSVACEASNISSLALRDKACQSLLYASILLAILAHYVHTATGFGADLL